MLAHPEELRNRVLAAAERLLRDEPQTSFTDICKKIDQEMSVSESTVKVWIHRYGEDPLWHAFMQRIRPRAMPHTNLLRSLTRREVSKLVDMVVDRLPAANYDTIEACYAVAEEMGVSWIDLHALYCVERIRRAMGTQVAGHWR